MIIHQLGQLAWHRLITLLGGLVLLGALAGCASNDIQEEGAMSSPVVPPIDLRIHAEVQTATFSLG
jgi:hypothetical protein